MDRAVNQGPWLQERVGWQLQKRVNSKHLERRPLGPPLGPRLGLGGGSKGFGAGGVGGRGTGPRDGANFATCVVFLTRTKIRKMIFFEGYPCGVGGGTRAREGGV